MKSGRLQLNNIPSEQEAAENSSNGKSELVSSNTSDKTQAQIGHAHLSVKQSIRFDLCSTGMITVYKKATRRISLPAAGEQCSPVSQQPPSGQDHHISGMRHSPRQKSPSDRVQSKHSLKPCLSERQKENKQADMHFLPGSHSATLTICFDIH